METFNVIMYAIGIFIAVIVLWKTKRLWVTFGKSITKFFKNLFIIILAILLSSCVAVQDKRFTAYVYSDPVATEKDGFNIGGGVEYQKRLSYMRAHLFWFPDLNGKTLVEFNAVGYPLTSINLHTNNENWRFFGGLKGNLILRDRNVHPGYGFEHGIDFYPNKTNWFVGVLGSYDYRTDGTVWESDAENYWRYSGVVKIGITF